MGYKLHVSAGNMKLGRICSVSFAPVKGCPPNVPCSKLCYAQKAYRRPNVRNSWDENLAFFNADRLGFFKAIDDYLTENRMVIRFFRWHVAGDIKDQNHLDLMSEIGMKHTDMMFLAFTKNHGLDFRGIPKNFTCIASMWTGWGDPSLSLRKAWYQDGKETRIPEGTMECMGSCDKCGLCWHLPDLGRDVVFYKH